VIKKFYGNYIARRKIHLVLFFLLLISFLLFISRLDKYGISYDETLFYQYADLNIHALYANFSNSSFDDSLNFYDLKYYGASYILIGQFIIDKIDNLFSNINQYKAWHVLNFSTFLLGAWILFVLTKRWVKEKYAIFSSLLYLSQPLLWGHGIMNPKDIPFMVFFLASVTIGMIAVDKIWALEKIEKSVNHESKGGTKKGKTLFLILTLVTLSTLSVLDRISSNTLSQPLFNKFISFVLSAKPESAFYSLKNKIETGINLGIPLEQYADKAFRIINSIEFLIIASSIIFLIFLFLKHSSKIYHWILFASVSLGLTMAIRTLGPAAGGLVSIYALQKLEKKAWINIFIYFSISILVMYLFWPWLWLDPLNRFFEAFRVMSEFPWLGSIRFNHQEILSTDLPWNYLPQLISIQFTLPLVLFSLFGMAISFKNKFLEKNKNQSFLVLWCWFLIPLILAMLLRPTMYDNFRQFLFVIPPLFVFASISLERLSNHFPQKHAANLLMLFSVIPGIVSGIWLSPYEYVYYNALVGWTGNVGRRFEADYWNTSYCEAGRYLTENAEENSVVAFTDRLSSNIFLECAEKDFIVVVERSDKSELVPDYSVVSTRYDDDLDYFRNLEPIHIIQRGNTPFTVIRKNNPK